MKDDAHSRPLWLVLKVLIALVGFALATGVVLSSAPKQIRSALARLGDAWEKASAIVPPPLIAERQSTKCVWLKQNWSDDDRAWFHNVSQGTATFPMPYAWFQHLERPELTALDVAIPGARLSDPAYLDRLGFIPPNTGCDPAIVPTRPNGYGVLPVGFAVLKGGLDPATGREMEDGLGLTCAACHTGRVFYKDTELRIDGAPAMIDIGNLERIIGLSVCYTDLMPWRAHRLVRSVVGDHADAPADVRDALRERTEEQLSAICKQKIQNKVMLEREVLGRRGEQHTEEGFGRLDALNRIGNQVFHENLLPDLPDEAELKNMEAAAADAKRADVDRAIRALDSNFAAHSAPVSFPAIWDVPHFVWAQYDASILDPGIRNIGEALGVSARVNMGDKNSPQPLFASSVEFDAIEEIEALLRGKDGPFDGEVGFKGLQAPRWDDAASNFPGDENWTINGDAINEGRKLYAAHCVECHGSPPRDTTITPGDPGSFWDKANWREGTNELIFDNKQKSVAAMGTDPQQARVLTERTVKVPPSLGLDTGALLESCKMLRDPAFEKSYALNLMDIVARVRNQHILDTEKRLGRVLTSEERTAILGTRPNCPNPGVFVPVAGIDVKTRQVADTAAAPIYVAKPHYRVRPLDGIWATAPYLHNGSVPTLDDLLSPQRDRPRAFCVGPMQFDTKRVGLTPSVVKDGNVVCEPGQTLFDVTVRGNSNLGHSFEGDGKALPAGVIGPGFDAEQRAQLIAYLKTL
ncbi:di-heme-cytochrome C peroxidase [Ensifer sp.]|jgi:mono/diheme cytochrome c family protein|uniref:di-heme-cytochrome C peroxidase n=1 Tax=Ensifer sp. TaxID=1872086 RepID=UPI002E0E8BD8|nr:di-heme-cytochrome C peroxidase [Ensifer sp.]